MHCQLGDKETIRFATIEVKQELYENHINAKSSSASSVSSISNTLEPNTTSVETEMRDDQPLQTTSAEVAVQR